MLQRALKLCLRRGLYIPGRLGYRFIARKIVGIDKTVRYYYAQAVQVAKSVKYGKYLFTSLVC